MPKLVYIETTIPSQYFSRRTDAKSAAMQEWTHQWWNGRRSSYQLVSSPTVLRELAAGEHPDRDAKLGLLKEVRIFPEVSEIENIVDLYITNKLMPADGAGDAAHLAYASFFGCDYLLTWNCRHIANHNKEAHMRVINGRAGLTSPTLLTPHELLNMEEG
jgi:hypothetical protein